MRKILLSALVASSLALPAVAQPTWRLQDVLIEPQYPTTSDRIQVTVVGEGQCYNFTPVSDEAARVVVVNLEPQSCVAAPLYFPQRATFEIGPLPAGQHFVEILVGDDAPDVVWREPFEVGPDTHLDLGADSLLHARVHWSNPRDGSSGSGHAWRLTRDSGAFWFFSPDNPEITVKVLDGRAINGRWWVFIASMTDLQFEVEVWRADGPVKTYVQAAGANRNFIDINASLEGLPHAVSDPALGMPRIVTAARPALRLGEESGDHFDIEVSYRLPGEGGFATAPGVPVTPDSAYFYFFDPENVEVTAKVLDGRPVNGHWWVFLANMTTVELEIEVTRCPPDGLPLPCVTQTYVQPPGQNRNFLDTSTF